MNEPKGKEVGKSGEAGDPSLSEFPEPPFSFLEARGNEFEQVAHGNLSIGSLPPSLSVHSVTPTSRALSPVGALMRSLVGVGVNEETHGDSPADPNPPSPSESQLTTPISQVARPRWAAVIDGRQSVWRTSNGIR